jgi:hypothetical protein
MRYNSARMIVLCEAPVYVEGPIGGPDVYAGSTAKGVLCLKANLLSGLSWIRLSAR